MEHLERTIEIVEQLRKHMGEARAELVILRDLCGLLLGEVVRRDPDPEGRLNTLAGMMRKAVEAEPGTVPLDPTAEVFRLAQAEAVEGVIRIAEAQFGRPQPHAEGTPKPI